MKSQIIVFHIDDDIDDREFFLWTMSKVDKNIRYYAAVNGIQALDMLKDKEFIPDLIFIDINMPGMNGIDCLAAIKKIKRLEHIPVYIHSTCKPEQMAKNCLGLGAAGFIQKRSELDEVQEQFEQIIASLHSVTECNLVQKFPAH